MVEEHFGLQADLDEDGDHLHVVRAVRVAVHAHGHEEVLCWAVQLGTTQEDYFVDLWLFVFCANNLYRLCESFSTCFYPKS